MLHGGHVAFTNCPDMSRIRLTTPVGAGDYLDGTRPWQALDATDRGAHQGFKGVPMSATPSPAQSELYAGLLPIEPGGALPAVQGTILEADPLPRQPSLHKRVSRTLIRFLIAFCLGVAATLAWQSYGGAAREMIVNTYPELGWLAPQAEVIAQNASETIDLDAVRQSIDRVAASIAAVQEQVSHSADRVATEQMAHSVARLAAGQEQMTREIMKLQAVEQYVLFKSSEPLPRPAPGAIRNPVSRPLQAR